jgi:biopolymer transport protein ExbD
VSVKIRRRKGAIGDITTASMSDIAFLLLIFFIVTTVFLDEQGLPMQLPGAASEQAKINPKNILKIEIAANNQIMLDGAAFSVTALEGEVRRRKAANDKLVIQLKVDKDAFYGTMVDVLDELHLADAKKISLSGMQVE